MNTLLDRLAPDEQKKVLSGAAKLVLPDPGLGEAGQGEPDETATEAWNLVTSLRQHFGKKHAEKDVHGRVVGFLSERMMAVHLQGIDIAAVKERLSSKGLLPITSYKLAYHPVYEARSAQLQIRRRHIEDAVSQPTAIQRFVPADHGMTSGELPVVLLITKTIHDDRRGESTLFIQTAIKDQTLAIGQTLRIFREDIARPADTSPLALLQAFLETFGARFSLEGSKSTLMIFMEAVRWRGAGPGEIDVTFRDESLEDLAPVALIRPSPLGALEVALAFFIQMKLYLSSLTRRGVHIDRNSSPDRLGIMTHPSQELKLSHPLRLEEFE